MYQSYIVRASDGGLMCFYRSNDGIYYRKYENNRWQKPLALAQNAGPAFTVGIDRDDNVSLLYKDRAGSLIRCEVHGGQWRTQAVLSLRDGIPDGEDTVFFDVPGKNGHVLVYNTQNADEGNRDQYLTVHGFGTDGKAGATYKLDKVFPMPDSVFQAQFITNDHALLFYQTRAMDNILGYREITTGKVSEFVKFHSTSFSIIEASYLTTYDSVHMLYIVKGLFSAQLIYRKRDEGGFSSPYPVWESQRIRQCMMSIVNGRINISFVISGALFTCSSDDGGDTFSRPQRHRGTISQEIEKAAYITNETMDENRYFMRELYVDKYSPWSIQLLPEMIDDFYTVKNPDLKTAGFAVETIKTPETDVIVVPPDKNPEHKRDIPRAYETEEDFFNRPFFSHDNKVIEKKPVADNMSYAYQRLKERLIKEQEENAEKDKLIANLSDGLAKKNTEYENNESGYAKQIKTLESELITTKTELDAVTSRLKDANTEIERMKKLSSEKPKSIYDIYKNAENEESVDEPVKKESLDTAPPDEI